MKRPKQEFLGGTNVGKGVLGILAFVLFFVNDWNDWKWGKRALRGCFPAGALLLVIATVLQLCGRVPRVSGVWKWMAWAFAVGFAALMIYALFFALPRAQAYGSPGENRTAQTEGMYALCRHPGVLWFIGLFFCLWLLGLPLWVAVTFCMLNVLLAAFEDALVFPAKLSGYEQYRQTTPFLMPSRSSILASRRKK